MPRPIRSAALIVNARSRQGQRRFAEARDAMQALPYRATEPPLPVSIDGELLARTPITARIAAGVFEVIAPA